MSQFKEQVLDIVRSIPRGSVLSYAAVAERAGSPGAGRAVGTIVAANHDQSVPCHRVIKSDGSLGGYNGGEIKKAELLHQEGALPTPIKPYYAHTLCFVIKGDEVLLGMKKKGFGRDKWNGFGGKQRKLETVVDAAKRELREESGLVMTSHTNVGTIRFHFVACDYRDSDVTIFVTDQFEGNPVESVEMRPKWWPIDALPYDQMWESDMVWLPQVLAGQKVSGYCVFAGDTMVQSNIVFV